MGMRNCTLICCFFLAAGSPEKRGACRAGKVAWWVGVWSMGRAAQRLQSVQRGGNSRHQGRSKTCPLPPRC